MIPDKVLTFEDLWAPQGHHQRTLADFWSFALRSRGHQVVPGLLDESSPAYSSIRTTFAVGAGWRARWLNVCNLLGCVGAEDASYLDPRFFCLSCYNVTIGGRVRPVVFPNEREEIEQIVLARPVRQISTYEPGETVDLLREQNKVIDALAKEFGLDAVVVRLKALLGTTSVPVAD